MFHGPAFQVAATIDESDANGASATFVVPPTTGFFRSLPEPAFVAEPVLLDAAGQLIGFWTIEQFEAHVVVFPYRLEALAIYGPALRVGERVTCQAQTTLLDGLRVTSDIDLVDASGHVRLRLQGWEDKRFDLTRRCYDFILRPGRTRLSQPWPAPLGDVDTRYVCRRVSGEAFSHVSGNAVDFFRAQSGFWEKALAHLILSRGERAAWRALKGPAKRRIDWLLGRLVAKEAMVTLAGEQFGLALHPADVEIAAGEDGRPVMQGEWLRQVGYPLALSIAHADGVAAAIVGPAGAVASVGIDIEPACRDPQTFVDGAFSPAEQALLADLGKSGEETWPLRLWCAKEAVGKALGCGLAGRPLEIVVREVDSRTGRVQVVLAGDLSRRFPTINGQGITARTVHEGDFVVASVLAEI
jgi:phosphopantetheinyl transferase